MKEKIEQSKSYECDYCGGVYLKKEYCEEHEKKCMKNPERRKVMSQFIGKYYVSVPICAGDQNRYYHITSMKDYLEFVYMNVSINMDGRKEMHICQSCISDRNMERILGYKEITKEEFDKAKEELLKEVLGE